jgi:hypothetical protein
VELDEVSVIKGKALANRFLFQLLSAEAGIALLRQPKDFVTFVVVAVVRP